jgi:hypothetical protein
MKKPHLFLKVAAVVSALLLSGGFIGYRGGAFNRIVKPAPEKMLSSSKLKVLSFESVPDAPPAETIPTPSSEQPAAVPNQQPPEASPRPTLMQGSKRGVIFEPTLPPLNEPQPAPSQPAKP